MLGYLIAGFIGFFIGVVASCILLAQKNLEKAQRIENHVSDTIKKNAASAKAVYNSYVAELDGDEAPETVEETDSNVESEE